MIGSPLTSAYGLREITKLNGGRELKSANFPVSILQSLWQSCNPGFFFFTTRPGWTAQNVFTLCKWALIKNPSHLQTCLRFQWRVWTITLWCMAWTPENWGKVYAGTPKSMQWRSVEDCFRDICAFGAGYKRAKGYGRAEFDAQEASTINEVKSKKDPGPCLDVVDPTSKMHAQNTQINLITDPRSHHLQDKTTKELITHKNSVTIEATIIHIPYRNLVIPKYCNK